MRNAFFRVAFFLRNHYHEFNYKRINIQFMFTPNTITNIDQSTAVTIKPALNLNAFKYLPCTCVHEGEMVQKYRTLFLARYQCTTKGKRSER